MQPTAPLNLTQKLGAHHRARPLIASETRRALITAAAAGGGGGGAGGDATRLTGQLRPAGMRDECEPFAPPQLGHLSPSKVSIADICLPVPNRNRKL